MNALVWNLFLQNSCPQSVDMSAEPPTTPQLGNGWSQPDPIMNFSRVYRRLAELPLLTSVSFVSRERESSNGPHGQWQFHNAM